jgi:hypothetical protein
MGAAGFELFSTSEQDYSCCFQLPLKIGGTREDSRGHLYSTCLELSHNQTHSKVNEILN